MKSVSVADWRALVDKQLAGVAFDKALVHTTAEGLRVAPLYTEAPRLKVPPAAPRARLCVPTDGAGLDEDLAGGVDALWIRDRAALDAVLERDTDCFLLLDASLAGHPMSGRSFALLGDALASADVLARLAPYAPRTVLVSTLAHHEAGADAADELALLLATGAAHLRTVETTGVDAETALARLTLQVSVGRDTFAELSKLRALRVVWQKMGAAVGAPAVSPFIHAVSSSRALAQRDPWVNMLRVTTQVFAAILGGADLVTPATFDAALGAGDALGRRVARNTLLVLRDESQLGRVRDPAAGSYYLDSFTDALAREAWQRFRTLEAEGGIVEAQNSGRLAERLAASWEKRRARLDTRKEAVLGVSEFANLSEAKLPRGRSPITGHRDAELFEALRDRSETKRSTVDLVTLGTPAEFGARVGFAESFFATGGLQAATGKQAAKVACLCGSDERYAAEAAEAAHALKAGGCKRVLLAGRPGALEAALRDAGVDDFLYIGCDAVSVLAGALEALS